MFLLYVCRPIQNLRTMRKICQPTSLLLAKRHIKIMKTNNLYKAKRLNTISIHYVNDIFKYFGKSRGG